MEGISNAEAAEHKIGGPKHIDTIRQKQSKNPEQNKSVHSPQGGGTANDKNSATCKPKPNQALRDDVPVLSSTSKERQECPIPPLPPVASSSEVVCQGPCRDSSTGELKETNAYAQVNIVNRDHVSPTKDVLALRDNHSSEVEVVTGSTRMSVIRLDANNQTESEDIERECVHPLKPSLCSTFETSVVKNEKAFHHLLDNKTNTVSTTNDSLDQTETPLSYEDREG